MSTSESPSELRKVLGEVIESMKEYYNSKAPAEPTFLDEYRNLCDSGQLAMIKKAFDGQEIPDNIRDKLNTRDEGYGYGEFLGVIEYLEAIHKMLEGILIIQRYYRNWSAKRALGRAMWPRHHPGGNQLRNGDNHPVAKAKLKLDNLRAELKESERQKAEVLEAGFRALQKWAESG
jgi:hypothetical protein